ncbi:hypothetical protein BCR32DRAFT_280954 [Anaeromyces robustus]|uniref:Uncharacterized protein n=1 Tax=Anaeromyces robustus TaxID=1754192 RepID=A0A1Y1X2U0_9FUNG|nr:hypothetical protein BCR32DRAFT_280954 [Anaeromyces robustus]|eukprot:ORX79975.1 hypothetical protein BCR32DRAFT_280954 [Anaeromyces robustus]
MYQYGFIDPINDYVFNSLFGFPKCKMLLIDFLNSILKLKNNNCIIDLKYTNNEKTFNDKNINVIAETKSNQFINIVVQINKRGDMGKRSLYYASDVILHSLSKTAPFKDIPNFIMINILNYNIIDPSLVYFEYNNNEEDEEDEEEEDEDDEEDKEDEKNDNEEEINNKEINNNKKVNDNSKEKRKRNEEEIIEYRKSLYERCHSIYTLKEKSSNKEEIYKNAIEFHFIEIQKFRENENIKKLQKKQYRWIKFLICPEAFIDSKKKVFQKAIRILTKLGNDRSFYPYYYQKEKDNRDYISIIEYEKKRFKKGFEKGYKEAYEKAFKEAYEKAFKESYEKAFKESYEKAFEEGFKEELEKVRSERKRKSDIKITLKMFKIGKKLDEVKEFKLLSKNEVDILYNFLYDENTNSSINMLATNLNIDENALKEILDSLEIHYIDKGKKRKT